MEKVGQPSQLPARLLRRSAYTAYKDKELGLVMAEPEPTCAHVGAPLCA